MESESNKARVNDVLEAHDAAKVRLRMYDINDGSLTVIEGTRETFRFLADVFAAMADTECDDFWLDPNGPGFAWFDAASKKGLYINRAEALDRAGDVG